MDTVPLIWLDHEALAWNVEQAIRMERFGDNPLPFWQRAYELAKRGEYLPDEIYGEWASARREEIAGLLRQSVQALARLYAEKQDKASEEEALLLLRSYWNDHPRDEDALRPLMELLGKRDCYQEALHYYAKLCALLEEDGQQPDPHTQDIATYLRTKQIQRQKTKRMPETPAIPLNGEERSHTAFSSMENWSPENRMGEVPYEKGHSLNNQRRKLLQQMLGIASTTLVSPLDLLLPHSSMWQRESESNSVFSLYEQLLAQSWDSYYTVSARQAVYALDLWLKFLTVAAKEACGEEQIRLLTLLCQFYQLSGVAARDRLDFHRALADGKTAIELAFHLENSELIAAALLRRAKTFVKNQNLASALQDFEAALSYAHYARDPLKGYVHQATAAMYAFLATQDHAFQSKSFHLFDYVATLIETGNLEDDHSFTKLNTAGLSIDQAQAFVLLQNQKEAHHVLEHARQQLGTDLIRWQTRLLTVDAEIYLVECDPQQSCVLAHHVLDLLQTTHSLSSKQQILALHQKLQQQFPSEHAVRHLGERLQAVQL